MFKPRYSKEYKQFRARLKKQQKLRAFKEALCSLDKECEEYKEYVSSLEFHLDTQNEYFMTDIQKEFVFLYTQYHDPFVVGEMLHLTLEETVEVWSNYYVKRALEELAKILFHKQLVTKLDSVDELGGYLTSLLTDQNIPECNKLSSKEKLSVCDLIIKLNEFKATLFIKSTDFIHKDLPEGNPTKEKIINFLKSRPTKEERQRKTSQLPPEVSVFERIYLETLPKDQFDMITDNIIEKMNELKQQRKSKKSRF